MSNINIYTTATCILQKNLALAITIKCPKCDTEDVFHIDAVPLKTGNIIQSTFHTFLCENCQTSFKIRNIPTMTPVAYLPIMEKS